MKFPKMRPRQALELKIPDLAGGLNLRDGLSEVLDNQLTNCKNMWWSDGVFKTRPGMKAVVTPIGRPTKQYIKTRDFPEIKHSIAGETYYLQVAERVYDATYSGVYTTDLIFFWRNERQAIRLTEFCISVNGKNINYFVCCKKNFLYCFTGDFKIHKFDTNSNNSVWEEVKEEEYYEPIVYTHCTAVNFSGTQIEGINLLGNKFKLIYSTINLGLSPVTADDGSGNVSTVYLHDMHYPFPDSLITNPEQYIGKEIKAIITNENGDKITHSAVFTKIVNYNNEKNAEGWETSVGADGLVMKIRTDGLYFHVDNGSGDPETMAPAKI